MPKRLLPKGKRVSKGDNPFGELLRDLRMASGRSQQEIAGDLGRSISFVSLLESGTRRPNADTVARLVDALRLAPADADRLWQASGTRQLSLPVKRDALANQLTHGRALSEAERDFVRRDLDAQEQGLRDIVHSIDLIRTGHYDEAHAGFVKITEQPELSPTLHAMARIHLANSLEQRGESEAADRQVEEGLQTATALEQSTTWGVALKAELLGVKGAIELRRGRYVEAASCTKESLELYASMRRSDNTEQPLALEGLGRSMKRLAQVELFNNNASAALQHCLDAEEYFRGLKPGTQMLETWKRSILSLKAWALSELGDLKGACDGHEEVRRRARDAGDDRGAARAEIYLADDYRRPIERALADVELIVDGQTRQDAIRDIMAREGNEALNDHLRSARLHYEAAEQQLHKLDDQTLLSHLDAGLATIHRIEAAITPAEEKQKRHYSRARELLNNGKRVERRLSQYMRLPKLYEVSAKVQWDRELYEAASEEIQDASDLLRSLLTDADGNPRVDPVCSRMLSDFTLMGQRLKSHPVASFRQQASEQWDRATGQLRDLVLPYLRSSHISAVAESSSDAAWATCLLRWERLDGTRLVAQDNLSSALGRASDEAAEPNPALAERIRIVDEQIKKACATREFYYHDLCCAPRVEQDLPRTRARVEMAASLLKECDGGYRLSRGVFQLPLAFGIKGGQVLLEIPDEHATVVDAASLGAQRRRCFAIESDPDLARKLAALFDELVNIAESSISGDSIPWLESLLVSREPAF